MSDLPPKFQAGDRVRSRFTSRSGRIVAVHPAGVYVHFDGEEARHEVMLHPTLHLVTIDPKEGRTTKAQICGECLREDDATGMNLGRVRVHTYKVGCVLRSAEVTSARVAAVSLIERPDGRVLCVWNRRYAGWSLPGGMVEDGETVEAAQRRELVEETGLVTRRADLVFHGEHGLKPKTGDRGGRASLVSVFRVVADGLPQCIEDGCPVTWLTREEFVEKSPFGAFYARVFASTSALPKASGMPPPASPPARFKVGDRVRLLRDFYPIGHAPLAKGTVGRIAFHDPHVLHEWMVDWGHVRARHSTEDLDAATADDVIHSPAVAAPASMCPCGTPGCPTGSECFRGSDYP